MLLARWEAALPPRPCRPARAARTCLLYIYVASQLTNHVFRFGAGGKPLGSFTGGGLSSPMGIAILDGEVFVTGGASDSVCVYDLASAFQRKIARRDGDPALSGPQGIAFDDRGRFAVSSFYTGRVALYAKSGERLLLFEDAGLKVGRSVAFLPLPAAKPEFVRGDANGDARVDVSDPVALLAHLFLGGDIQPCTDAADADDSGVLDITDAVAVLAHLFTGGRAPPAPFPERGPDPTADALSCP